MNKIIKIIIILFIIFIISSEIDRCINEPSNITNIGDMRGYYFQNKMYPLGFINNIIRITHPYHRHTFNPKIFKSHNYSQRKENEYSCGLKSLLCIPFKRQFKAI
jgi:hypothetical protein